jgi:diguanylate cyclase (GGDEF)-like protein
MVSTLPFAAVPRPMSLSMRFLSPGTALRSRVILALVLLLSLATIAAIASLERRSATSRQAELTLQRVDGTLDRLQGDPFLAIPALGGTAATARAATIADQRSITAQLETLRRDAPSPVLRKVSTPLRANFDALDRILPISSAPSFNSKLDPRFFPLLRTAGMTSAATSKLLAEAARDYRANAASAERQALIGTTTAILLLFLAFALVFRSSHRARLVAEELAEDNARLASEKGHEARTDALTGLPNRRALIDDLATALDATSGESELILGLFDLDGFKHYNDTFGHPAGDELLTRLGASLAAALPADSTTAYRMGGDEFCVLVLADPGTPTGLLERAAAALSERGDAFEIGCSYGSARIPAEATTAEEALGLSDQRMYAHKTGRSSASRQSTDVLLKVLSERSTELREHMDDVASLAVRTAERIGLPAHEVKRIGLAAELHDVGKAAIPDAILNKPGPLDDDEWEFMRHHTIIGERIILAAPSLATTATLVRASHEAFDGTGYPDALRGEEIPIGARIIAVSDAYDAMISERAYRRAMPVCDALAELRRCAGGQFDPDIVAEFCALVTESDEDASQIAVLEATGR